MSAPMVTLTIDGKEVTVPAGTLIIRAAEQLGIEIPRFCDHPLLDPVGACRQTGDHLPHGRLWHLSRLGRPFREWLATGDHE